MSLHRIHQVNFILTWRGALLYMNYSISHSPCTRHNADMQNSFLLHTESKDYTAFVKTLKGTIFIFIEQNKSIKNLKLICIALLLACNVICISYACMESGDRPPT